ncbi:glycosyltransferase [Methylosinus sporium]|uniref:Glycosyltransferase n=1 Tax=Methylosinus sporium TaxID=428 RepID=A0A549SQ57_METSR|nr:MULTISPECIES: glycosyltransferase [Methylosinus]MBU3888496.1 glycosyltransferase [Methylosinus sp. KRF6]TRL31744.1 glycosyltransferase [Methylosinus sporium]
MPRVSIVLPTYNGARHLREALDTCLHQTFGDFELIVVVDGSFDETKDILATYADRRLVTVMQENLGLPQALNSGFARARGVYWSWTSDDNAFLPSALQTMVDYLDARPDTPMVSADFLRIDDAGRTIGYDDGNWACFLYRADVARRVGNYRPEYRLVEDKDFFLRLQHVGGPIERIRQPLYRYRDHARSLTRQEGSKRHITTLRMHYDLITRGIEKHLNLRQLFFHELNRTALYRDHEQMTEILTFARETKMPFVSALESRDRRLRSQLGWLLNRLNVAATTRREELQRFLARRVRDAVRS